VAGMSSDFVAVATSADMGTSPRRRRRSSWLPLCCFVLLLPASVSAAEFPYFNPVLVLQRGDGGPRMGRGPGMRRMPPPGFHRDRRDDGAPGEAGPRGPMPPVPPPLMEKLKNLPPEEQENVIKNNEHFQQLPKEQQDRLLRRWRRFQALPQDQKEMILKRGQAFNRLTVEQRQKIRELMPRWQALPEDRHKALQEEFRKMREMTPEDRDKHLSSKDVENNFNPEERDLLKQLNSLGPMPPPPGRRRPTGRFGPPPPLGGPPPTGNPQDLPQAQPPAHPKQ
jgi:hypothetical protein